MKINVNDKCLLLKELVEFIKEKGFDDNSKVLYDNESGLSNITYCRYKDLITFIPDYDKNIEPLTILNLKNIIKNGEPDTYITMNFAEDSEIYGVTVAYKDEHTGNLTLLIS